MDWVNGLTIVNIYQFNVTHKNLMNEDSATMEIDKKRMRNRKKNIDFV